MPRRSDIPFAFDIAVKRNMSTGRYTITTRDFIHELTLLNHHFSPREANEWIKLYEPRWGLYEEGEHGLNTYTRFNPN